MKRSLLLTAVLGVGVALTLPSAAVAGPHCSPGWHFTDMKKKRVRMLIHERQRAANVTNLTKVVTFSSRKSRTVKMATRAGQVSSYNAILSAVRAKVDASVKRSVTAPPFVSVRFALGPRRVAEGKYGIFIRPVRGRLTRGDSSRRCTFDRRITAYLPRAYDWRVSTSPL